MNNPKISIIAAIDEKRGIGKDNGLITHFKEDMKHFRDLTRGHIIIMGRKQFESKEQQGKPLPNKVNIVITRQSGYNGNGAVVVSSLQEAIEKAKEIEKEEIFIIGGGQIFKEALDQGVVDILHLTLVKGDYHADTFFPEYPEFTKVISEEHGESDGYEYTFMDLVKGR